MVHFLRSLYLNQRLFLGLCALAIGFLFSYWFPELYPIVWVLTSLLGLLVLFDLLALYQMGKVVGERIVPERFSNSDRNPVEICLKNFYPFRIRIAVIDEIPVQFQKRNFLLKKVLPGKGTACLTYHLTPKERGNYSFGYLNVYASSPVELVKRKTRFDLQQTVKVYPSFIQMKKYDFMALDQRITQPGLKKIRKIGQSLEFEQIRNYVQGDDMRSVNWKATAKHGDLMVNHYQDERAQPVYSLIDTGRSMKMPFDGLKLLDYAINSALAFSNIAIRRKDKAGLITFSNKLEHSVPASSRKTHLNLLLETLYKIDTRFLDSDMGLLYSHLKRKLPQRSLLLLYTNFEHLSALRRQLPYLLSMARQHLLVVIFFENTELDQLIEKEVESIPEIFDQTIAQDFAYEKRLMVRELQKHGIQTILTKPEDLTLSTINKYLEIKKRGLL